MRPVRLCMQAFGAYPTLQVVDFRELAGRGFFLIHGPTGSGKTTVLDALCFALYGVTSGADREARMMRSHHAAAEIPTYVEFDFAVGSKVFRVRRSLEHEVPNRKTPIKADATLWDITNCGEGDEGRVLATGLTRSTDAVTGILGFEDRQFRQVVVLPQGQFRQALTAKSEERQAIFQVLFDTDQYARVELALRDDASKLRSKLDKIRDRITADLASADVKSEDELRILRDNAEQECTLCAERERAAQRTREVAQDALKQGETAERLLVEAEIAARELESVRRRECEIQELRKERDMARRAQSCIAADENFARVQADEAEAIEEQARATMALEAAREGERTSRGDLEEERSPERVQARQAAARQVVRLEELWESVHRLDSAREELIRCQKLRAKAKAQVEAAEDATRGASANLKALEIQREQVRGVAAESGTWVQKAELLHGAVERARKRALLEASAVGLQESLATAEHEAELARQGLDQARAAEESMRNAWIHGQAAVIASHLVDGEPCPVCGSSVHPSPAAGSTEGLCGAEALREAEGRVRDAQRSLDKANDAVGEVRNKLAGIEGQLEALDAGTRALEELEDEHTQAVASLKASEAARAQLIQVETELGQASHDHEKAERTKGEAAALLLAASTAEASAEATVRTLEDPIPVDLRSEDALRHSIEQAKAQSEGLEKALERAQKAFDEAAAVLNRAETEFSSASSVLATSVQRKSIAWDELLSAVRAAGFASVDDYRAAAVTRERMETLDAAIDEFEAALRAARQRDERAREAAKGTERPDLEALAVAHDQAQQAEKDAVATRASAQTRHRDLTRICDDVDARVRERDSVEAQYAIVNRIAEVSAGRLPNRLGMNFERFVMASMLDQVAEAATHRLQVMSRGRYSLRRTDQRKTVRSAAGLELEVHDEYTGRERAVSTLSGGEGFMASLALALGLADVVQSYSGGIKLDTIFVDEGFGTLDPETLDLAIDTLVGLQRDGGRLVGVISHVPELMERIDARLEVTMTECGSRARFVVG